MSWLLVPLAFAAMAAQDVTCVLMVRAEGTGRAHRAAACDVLQDALGLASLGAVGSSLLVGNDLALSAAVIAARLAGDYAGTYAGVRFGVWLDSRGRAQVSGQLEDELWAWFKRAVRRRGGER